jgi:hypothetical protein
MSKPRKFSKPGIRAECIVADDGERIIDMSADVFDGKELSATIVALSKWLSKAAKWTKEKEPAGTP